jgi:hypothetical protein
MDIRIPAFYVLNRNMDREQAALVLQALRITPVFAALVSDIRDAQLAITFAPQVLRANTEEDAYKVALAISAEKQMPCLILGTANFLDAVYHDGQREQVAAQA